MQFVKPKPFKEAVEKLGAKSVIGSNLKSSEWLEVPAGLRERAFFSATVESVRFLQEGKDFIDGFLTGARDPEHGGLKAGGRAQFVKEMREFAIAIGLGPLTDDDKGTIKDITSEKRLSLIFNVQTQAANDFGYWKQGMDPDLINEFPAQRFIREADVKIERPLHMQNEGVVRLKTDLDFWLAMNSPLLGGFGVPWGPWGFGSGMAVEDVDRDEAETLGLIKPGQKVQPVDKDFNDRLGASVRNLDDDLVKKLKGQFGSQIVIKDGIAWWKGNKQSKDLAIPPVPKAAKVSTEEPSEFPKRLSDLEEVKILGGTTVATLMRDKKTGEQFVLKRGNSAEHIREEFLADELYRVLGVAVPNSKLYEDGDSPVKIAKFIEGQTLGAFFKKSGPGAQRAVLEKIRRGYVADSLLGNWDVAGLNLDNILVDAQGNPWRIDNGGSLRYRAQGAKKVAADWGPHVEEFKSLLDAKLNPSTARVFANLTDTELSEQLTKLIANREKLLAAAPAELKDVLRQRIDSLITQISPANFTPGFTAAVQKARRNGPNSSVSFARTDMINCPMVGKLKR